MSYGSIFRSVFANLGQAFSSVFLRSGGSTRRQPQCEEVACVSPVANTGSESLAGEQTSASAELPAVVRLGTYNVSSPPACLPTQKGVKNATFVFSKPPSSEGPTDDVREISCADEYSSLEELYALDYEIGQGGFGRVYAGRRKDDNLPVALKYVTPDDDREVQILLAVNFVPGVIELIDYFNLRDCNVLVLERPAICCDLYHYVVSRRRLGEDVAGILFKRILVSIVECHKLGVVHRDLKCENVLVDVENLNTRLIDFGCGSFIEPDPTFNYYEYPGTPVYNPPEWHASGLFFAESGTVWSLGITLYFMLHGTLPFLDGEEVLTRRLSCSRSLSYLCTNLIEASLHREWDERILLQDLLSHPWVSQFKLADLS